MGSISRKICSQLFTVAFLMLLQFSFSSPLLKSADAFNLTVENPASGSGDINGTVTCTLGALGECTTPLPDGTVVTLAANPDWKSIFTGWGAPCSGTGSCVLTLTADALVIAPFSPNNQAIVLGMNTTEYTTLTEAYANANDGSTIAAHVYSFDEDLILTQPRFIRLYGGREGGEYLATAGFTTLQRTLVVQQGTVEIDSLIIQ